MRVFFVAFFILFLTTLTNVTIDLIGGDTLFEALTTLQKTFNIIGAGEYVMLTFLVFIIIGNQIYQYLKNKNQQKA
ncbi:hypothetical protein [Metabacillus schmidteae]|uniref:hypothetical protein n=1 Tax=Metabacillus schmidteae TaxID=2730405 RepID=UPI00158B794A|nr:hypothetical protein [Metabacillus schmidteae]